MRQLLTVVVFLLFAADAAAQTQAPRQSVGGRGHFGAPAAKITVIRDQTAVMPGGRGGWNITPSLIAGFGLYGTLSEVDAPEGVVPFAPGPLDIKFENFGFDLDFAVRPAAPTHLTMSTFFGGAAARYARDKTNEQHGETDFMLLVEPVVGWSEESPIGFT